jgi:diguanylate cyclase (GGDEF)-like protein
LGRQASSWSTEQLTEFLAVITRAPDADTAVRAAVERAAEALDCEVGAFVRGHSLVTSVGFAVGRAPEVELVEVSEGRLTVLVLPGGALAATIAVQLEDAQPGRIVLARSGSEQFGPEEVIVLRGMARILGMTLTTIRTLESLRSRQRLLERSASIQSAITRRTPLQEILDLITEGAGELLGDEVVGLRLIDPEHPDRTRTVASSGVDAEMCLLVEHGTVGEGVGGRAIAEDRLVVVDDYATLPHALQPFVDRGLQAAMAAPIHDEGTVIGSLVVASYAPGRVYLPAEQELLVAFAQHASLALLDARNVDKLLRQALHDPLTSLANRTLFLDRLEHALARAERVGLPLSVLFIDLDRFKAVNDTFGHGTGDALLVEVGERLRSSTRTTDTVARFGGDEFAVLLEDAADQPAAARIALAIIERLREVFVIDGEEILMTASIGIAIAHRRGEDPLRDADLAMYLAKAAGHGRCEFFAAGMRVAMLERLELEADLKHALERGGLVLHYQPIADLETGAISGLEALIRWQHPQRGLLPPAAFIPLAEETGAIFAIGQWVLQTACRAAAAWVFGDSPLAHGQPFVSVNLAPIQLQQVDLVEVVASTLAETRLDPARLVLEITESSLLDDSRAIQTLRGLKDLGVRLAVDDFGTGYSSLHYLQRFPLDALKIPKTFVDHLGENSDQSALARAIIELGRTFGLDVIAEGIERPEQLAHLRALGCKAGQGFLLAHPRDAAATEALLRKPPLLFTSLEPAVVQTRALEAAASA